MAAVKNSLVASEGTYGALASGTATPELQVTHVLVVPDGYTITRKLVAVIRQVICMVILEGVTIRIAHPMDA